jgi:hypothetical protein
VPFSVSTALQESKANCPEDFVVDDYGRLERSLSLSVEQAEYLSHRYQPIDVPDRSGKASPMLGHPVRGRAVHGDCER